MEQQVGANPAPLRRRSRPLSLLDLPNELLSEITRILEAQDLAFRHRVKLIRAHAMTGTETFEILRHQERLGYGSSLNAWFMLCKVTNELAAPFLFKTVKASRTTTSLVYQYYVEATRLHHFKHVVLDGADADGLNRLIASLRSLPSLDELTINGDSAMALFGRSNPWGMAWDAIQQKKSGIQALHLRDFDFARYWSPEYVRGFDYLRSLSLTGGLKFTPATKAALIRNIKKLEHLTLDQLQSEEASFPEIFTQGNDDWPALVGLTIKSRNWSPSMLHFIERFHLSLKELTLATPSDDDLQSDVADSLSNTICYPLLQTISILGSSLVAQTIFLKTTRASFPSLSHVRLSYSDESETGFAQTDTVLHSVLHQHRIRSLQYDPPDQIVRPDCEAFLKARATALRFRLEMHDCPLRTLPDTVDVMDAALTEDYWEDLLGDNGGQLRFSRRTIEERMTAVRNYLGDAFDTARIMGNSDEIERLLQHLRPIEYERLAHLD